MYDYHNNRKLHNNEITVNSITVTDKMITIIIQINCLGLLDIRTQNLILQLTCGTNSGFSLLTSSRRSSKNPTSLNAKKPGMYGSVMTTIALLTWRS